MDGICKATHAQMEAKCELNEGHEEVLHTDGIFYWRDTHAVYPAGDPATEVGGTVSRPAKKTAAKRAPKKEG